MGLRRSLFKTRVGTNELILYLHCILVYNIICKPCTQILSHSYNSYIHMIKYVCILIYIRHVCCCPLGSKRHELHLHPGLTWWCLPNLLPTTRCSDSWASVASVYPGRVWRISMFEEFILWFAMINHFVHPHGIGWNTMIWLACFFVFFLEGIFCLFPINNLKECMSTRPANYLLFLKSQDGELIEDDEFADFEKHDNVTWWMWWILHGEMIGLTMEL